MSKFTGIYRGAVHDINDPESRGRIRALVPAVLGDAPSGWAEPALSDQPDTPNWSVGDRVWLLFDGGDINRPVYMSRLEVKTGDLSPEVAASIENAGGPTSDGFAPPQVANLAAAGGIETLFLSWDAVANLDPVWYDVYVGTAASFVRDSTTLAATIEGTVVSLPRAAGTYYAVVVASDADGPGPVSAEVSTVVEAPFDSAALEVRLDANDVAVNSRTRTVVAAARPTGLTADDRVVWVDSDGGFRSEFWDGTAWGPWIYGSEALADAAITETKIALDAVTSAKIAAAAVTGAKIAAGAVDSAKIADAAVTAVKIGDAAVVAAKIAAGAVDSAKITDGAVVAAKIGPGAVTEVKISDTAVTAPKIATGAVVADKIAAGAVTANKLSVIPGGGNLLTNSGMEGSPLPFKNATNTTVAQSPDQAARGTKSLAMTAVAAGNMGVHQGGYTETTLLTPVMSGRPYMASVYVRAAVTSRTARIDYGWVDAAGTLIGAYTVGSSTIQDTSTGWTRLVQSLGIAPANAAFIRIIPFVLAAAAGEVHYLDLAQIEEGDIATSWAPAVSELLPGTILTSHLATDAVTADKIAAGAVTASEIAAGAVAAGKIAAGAVTATEIAAGAVIAGKIAANAVTATEIAADAVTSAKIAAGAVTASEIAAGAVAAGKIAAGAVTAAELAAGAVTANKLSVIVGGGNLLPDSSFEGMSLSIWTGGAAPGTNVSTRSWQGSRSLEVGCTDPNVDQYREAGVSVTPGTVYTVTAKVWVPASWTTANSPSNGHGGGFIWLIDYSNGTAVQIAYADLSKRDQWQNVQATITTGATTTSLSLRLYGATTGIGFDTVQLETGNVPTAWGPKADEILPGTIVASMLQAGAVVAGKIAAGAVTATEIAADAVTADKIAAGAVTASEIAAGAVIADKIAAGAVIADKVAAGAIVADKIATNAVTSVKIAASAVIADKIAAGAVIADKLDVATVADNSAVNGTFQELRAGDSTMPKYFVRGGWSTSVPNSAGCAIDTTVFETSPQSVKLTTGASPNDHPNFRTDTAIPVVPGETWFIGVRAKASVAMGGLYVRMMNQNGGEVNQAIENRSVTTAWADYSGTFTIPAGMTTMRVFVLKHNSASGSSLWVDKIYIQRVGASVRVADGTVEAAKIVAGAVNGTHINASYAYLGEVSFDQMTGGNITNAVTLSSLLSTRADEFSAGGEMDQVSLRGFGPPAAAGEEAPLIFEIPFDGSRAFFEGDVEARNFTSREGANIYGIANYVKADGEFKLDAGTTPSNSSPAVSQSVSSVVLQTNVSATVGWAAEPIQFNISQCFGFNWSDSLGGWLTNQIRAGGTLVWLITKTGAISLHTSYQYLSVVSSLTHPSGSMIYMDGYDVSGEGNLSRWTIRVRWSNGERSVAFNRTDTRADSKFHPTLGLDFQGNIRVAEQSGGNIIIRTFSIGSSTTNPSLLATTTSSGIWNGANSGVGSIECGPFDFADAANHHVIVPRRAVPGVMVFTNGSPTSEPKFNWKTPTDVIGISMDYHVSNANTGTGWWALGNDNRLYKFNSDTKFLSDTATTGQVTHVLGTTYATETAETAVGTKVKFEFNRRWHATVTAPILVAPATRHGVYLVKGSNTAVASSSMIRQGYTATGSRVFAMHTPIYTGSAPGSTPTNGVYPLSVAARLVSTESATPLVDIKGDGSWRLGPLSGSTSGALTVPVVGRTAMTYQSPATSGSIYYKVFDLGNAKMVSITSALGGSFSTTAQTVVTSANGIPAAYRPDNIENGHIRMSVGGVVGHLLIQTDGSIQVQSSAGGGVAQGTCTYFV